MWGVPAHGKIFVDSDISWDRVIKDSIHVYVVDRAKTEMTPSNWDPKSQVAASSITDDMILTRITLYHSDTNGKGVFDVTYP